jgi:plastocyanin
VQSRRVLVVLLSAFALTACGGGDEGTGTAAAVDQATPEAATPPPDTSTDVATTPPPSAKEAPPVEETPPPATPTPAGSPTPAPSTKPTYIPAPEETPARKKRRKRGPDDATHGSLTLTLTDFNFSSKWVKTKAGKLDVTIENVSPSAHEVVFVPADGGSVVARLPRTSPGQRIEETIRLPRGTFTFYCNVGNHAQEGMRGRIQVS